MFTGIVQGTAKLVSIDENQIFVRMLWSCLNICWMRWRPAHRLPTMVLPDGHRN